MTTTATAAHTLYERAAEIARLLGEGWSVAPSDPDRTWMDRVELNGPDGSGVYLEVIHYRQPVRMTVSGRYPHDPRHGSYAPRKTLSISVDDARPTDEIARTIARRFLPAYLERYAEARARQRATEEERAAKHAQLERLAHLVGGTLANPHQTDVVIHQNGISTTISTGTGKISLTLRGLPEEIAVRILTIVAEATTRPA
jgi:hypothetical protein